MKHIFSTLDFWNHPTGSWIKGGVGYGSFILAQVVPSQSYFEIAKFVFGGIIPTLIIISYYYDIKKKRREDREYNFKERLGEIEKEYWLNKRKQKAKFRRKKLI